MIDTKYSNIKTLFTNSNYQKFYVFIINFVFDCYERIHKIDFQIKSMNHQIQWNWKTNLNEKLMTSFVVVLKISLNDCRTKYNELNDSSIANDITSIKMNSITFSTWWTNIIHYIQKHHFLYKISNSTINLKRYNENCRFTNSNFRRRINIDVVAQWNSIFRIVIFRMSSQSMKIKSLKFAIFIIDFKSFDILNYNFSQFNFIWSQYISNDQITITIDIIHIYFVIFDVVHTNINIRVETTLRKKRNNVTSIYRMKFLKIEWKIQNSMLFYLFDVI